MTLRIIITVFLTSALSCRQPNSEKKGIDIKEVEMAVIKQGFTISWRDSGMIQFNPTAPLYTYPKLDYDSARLIFYWGANWDEGLDTTSFFPVNKRGQWISTIMNATTVRKADLHEIDSLLGDTKSFDQAAAAGSLSPKYGIVYFKTGKVIGQTALGPGSQTVMTTFKFPQPCYFQRLNNSEWERIEHVFGTKLSIEGL